MHFKDAVKNPNSIMGYVDKDNLQIFLGKNTSRRTVIFLYLVHLSDLELSPAEPWDFSWSIYSFSVLLKHWI